VDPFSLLFFLHGAGPEVLFVALGLLGVGRAMKRGARGRRRALPHPPPPPGERSRLNEARRALPRLQQLDTRRLPASIRLKVAQIRRKIETLLRHADEFPVGSEDLYVLQQTATEYLPSTLNAYMAMPPGSENAPVDAEGRTAWRILWDQLTLIESRLDTVAADVRRRNADRLVANGRFLEERFKNLGRSDLDLKDAKKPESDR
jgi:hypothetical protein